MGACFNFEQDIVFFYTLGIFNKLLVETRARICRLEYLSIGNEYNVEGGLWLSVSNRCTVLVKRCKIYVSILIDHTMSFINL